MSSVIKLLGSIIYNQNICNRIDSTYDLCCQDSAWGDNIFLQSAALFLRLRILVLHHGSSKEHPYILHGLETFNKDQKDLYLGFTGVDTAHPNHYQSLLPSSNEMIPQFTSSTVDLSTFEEPDTAIKEYISDDIFNLNN